jgi:hypothetical protein
MKLNEAETGDDGITKSKERLEFFFSFQNVLGANGCTAHHRADLSDRTQMSGALIVQTSQNGLDLVDLRLTGHRFAI